MRKTLVTGKSLKLKHEHFTATQLDILDFAENILLNVLGVNNNIDNYNNFIHTCSITESNGNLYIGAGWAFISGKIARVEATSFDIPLGNSTFSIVGYLSNTALQKYDYKKENDTTTYHGMNYQKLTIVIADNLINFENSFTIVFASRDTATGLTVDSSVAKSLRHYCLENFIKKTYDKKNGVLDAVSNALKGNDSSVITKYVEVSNWNMTIADGANNYTSKSVDLTDAGIDLGGVKNLRVLSASFNYFLDNNDGIKNETISIGFYNGNIGIDVNSCVIRCPIQDTFCSGTGFRGILKIELYASAQK